MPAAGTGARRPKPSDKFAVGADHLHAVVAGVGDGDPISRGSECGGCRGIELPVCGAARSRRGGKLDGPIVGADRRIVEYLHAVVAGVGDGDPVALPRKCDGMRIGELPGSRAARAKAVRKGAVNVEHLHAVVAGVGDGEHAVAGGGNVHRRRELAVGGASRAEDKRGNAVRIEYLHAVVAGIGDGEHAAVRDKGDRARLDELPRFRAARAELVGERAVRVEDLHAIVAGVGDGEHAVAAHGDASRRRELPAARAVGAELEGKCAVRIENPHAIVGSVGDSEHAGPQIVRYGGTVSGRIA